MQKMQAQSPERMEKMMQLKDDPELTEVFQDIQSNGPAAMEKYWDDTDLMSKIAKKMSALNVGPGTPPRSAEATSSKASMASPPLVRRALQKRLCHASGAMLNCDGTWHAYAMPRPACHAWC